MARYIDRRVTASGGSAGFLNLQDPINVATLMKNALAESPAQGISGSGLSTSTVGKIDLGGNLTQDTTIQGNDWSYDTVINNTEFLVNGLSNSDSLEEGSTPSIQLDQDRVSLEYLSAGGANTSVGLGMVGTENLMSLGIANDLGSSIVFLNFVQDDGDGDVGINTTGLKEFADNDAANAGGLDLGQWYVNSTTGALSQRIDTGA